MMLKKVDSMEQENDDFEETIGDLLVDPNDRIVIHPAYGDNCELPPLEQIDDCFMNNLEATKVRPGWGRFRSYYEVEWYYSGYHFIDTSRSFRKNACSTMRQCTR